MISIVCIFTLYLNSYHSPLSLRMGCFTGQSSCSPTPRQPDQCRRLKTCSECLARHPKTFSSTSQVTLYFLLTKEMAVIRQLKWLLSRIYSLLCSASGAQTVPKVHASAALSAAHPNMTAGSTRERSSCLATALRPAVRRPTAPSVLHLESACGRASSSAQVFGIVLKNHVDVFTF